MLKKISRARLDALRQGWLESRRHLPTARFGPLTALDDSLIRPVSYTHLDVYKRQVLKLFTVDEAECMEIFPAGGGVQVEAMFKRFQTDVDEPNRHGGIFRYPVYHQTGCVRDALGRTNLTVPYNCLLYTSRCV